MWTQEYWHLACSWDRWDVSWAADECFEAKYLKRLLRGCGISCKCGTVRKCGSKSYRNKIMGLVWMLGSCMRWVGFLSMTYETGSATAFSRICIACRGTLRPISRKVTGGRKRFHDTVFALHSLGRRVVNMLMPVPSFECIFLISVLV